MAATIANKARYNLALKKIDFANDSFKIILMDTGFVFNPDTHHGYSDVSGEELATGNGYTQNTKVLAGVSVTEYDAGDYTSVTWSNVSWTASGGDIGPTPGAIIFDDTVTDHADVIICYISFEADYTQLEDGVATITNIEVRI